MKDIGYLYQHEAYVDWYRDSEAAHRNAHSDARVLVVDLNELPEAGWTEDSEERWQFVERQAIRYAEEFDRLQAKRTGKERVITCDFRECGSCAARMRAFAHASLVLKRPGSSPQLCDACLHNRTTIDLLAAQLTIPNDFYAVCSRAFGTTRDDAKRRLLAAMYGGGREPVFAQAQANAPDGEE